MEITKKCFKCNITKPISEFYKHKDMSDGHLNKCKDCTKKDSKDRFNEKMKDPLFIESERKRGREKHYRLGYGSIYKPGKEKSLQIQREYRKKYPEKSKAKQRVNKRRKTPKGNNLHHWSYNEPHYLDVIELTIKEHAKAHRFIIYDQERMMYRRCDNNELLDTREKHESFIRWCIENKED